MKNNQPSETDTETRDPRLPAPAGLAITGIIVCAICTDGNTRAVMLEGKQAKQIKGYIQHIQGGRLVLHRQPVTLDEDLTPWPDIGPDPLQNRDVVKQGVEGAMERLSSVMSLQQGKVPDQTALVWRIDLTSVVHDLIWRRASMKKGGGAQLIAAERWRQISEEGYDSPSDDKLTDGQLIIAAKAYIDFVYGDSKNGATVTWPGDFSEDGFKPSRDPIRNLEKAGALIAAEIDRLKRAKISAKTQQQTKEPGPESTATTHNDTASNQPRRLRGPRNKERAQRG